ncbi:MAG: HAMP domain-containing sensor histidine kinase, partial [Candidatus Desulfatibia sp.]|uniref:sensor histidine kinase n=1 Tax=Candidatus Desulfatibia sp. TaxID=3101189 RepID=UPI002F324AEA
RSGGIVVLEKGKEPLSTKISPALNKMLGKRDTVSFVLSEEGRDTMFAYTPISISLGSGKVGFGGSYESLDHMMGNRGEFWYVILSHDLSEMLGSFNQGVYAIMWTGAVLILIMAIVALVIGKKVSLPVMRMLSETKKIGKGDFDVNIAISSNDELGDLARSFNKMAKDLKETTRLKDNFISLVSHDLKGPLGTMLGFLKLVRDDEAEPPGVGQRRILDGAMESGQNMVSLIENILNISRIRNGKLVPKLGSMDANMVAVKAMAGFTHAADEKGVRLVNKVPEKSYIYADDALFGEVIQNLVSNAIKFCNKGDSITIYIPDGEPTTIAVSDTGVGINSKRLDAIFNYEEKTSTTGTAGEVGTGMGLPLSRDIMKAHGGELLVESTENKETVFYAKLPDIK